MRIWTSPFSGGGTSRSSILRTSGPPVSWNRTTLAMFLSLSYLPDLEWFSSILRPCQFRRRGCRSSGAKYGGRALDPASSDISSGMERRVIEPRNCKRLQHRTCPQEIWSRAPRLLKRPDGDERTPRRSRLSPCELGLHRLL